MTLEVDQPLVARDPIGCDDRTDMPVEVVYPDSDGEPLSDNTLQLEWIIFLKTSFDLYFRDHADVFVAGDLLWYSVKGDNRTRLAPDTMVVFGRPKGYRGSYRQWEEGGIAPQVVFEVLSPRNRPAEMTRKRQWYARYGAEEYYEYDPDRGRLRGWLLSGSSVKEILPISGWTSPRLGVTFDLEGNDLVLIGPDGRRFQDMLTIAAERDRYAIDRDQERERAEQIAMDRDRERERADRLAALLRAAGLSDD